VVKKNALTPGSRRGHGRGWERRGRGAKEEGVASKKMRLPNTVTANYDRAVNGREQNKMKGSERPGRRVRKPASWSPRVTSAAVSAVGRRRRFGFPPVSDAVSILIQGRPSRVMVRKDI